MPSDKGSRPEWTDVSEIPDWLFEAMLGPDAAEGYRRNIASPDTYNAFYDVLHAIQKLALVVASLSEGYITPDESMVMMGATGMGDMLARMATYDYYHPSQSERKGGDKDGRKTEAKDDKAADTKNPGN